MRESTITIIEAALAADETVTKLERGAILQACHGTKSDSQLLTRGQVAAMFNVTAAAVDQWRRDGKLKGVTSPGGMRVIGFRHEDVQKLLRVN